MHRETLRRLALFAVLFGVLFFFQADHAWAFESAGSKITTSVCKAYAVGRKILITAATLAFMIGLAPMLWGDVKVRWLVSCLVFCVLVGVTGEIVGAFGGGGAC